MPVNKILILRISPIYPLHKSTAGFSFGSGIGFDNPSARKNFAELINWLGMACQMRFIAIQNLYFGIGSRCTNYFLCAKVRLVFRSRVALDAGTSYVAFSGMSLPV